MKRFLTLLLCGIVIISFSACNGNNKKNATPDINKLFSCTADITYGDFKTTATINRLGNGMWDVEFITPNTLAGVKLSYNGVDITASYKGLSFSIPKDAAPIKGVLNYIFKAIDKSAEKVNMPYTEQDGMKIFKGESDDGDFTLSIDKSNGNLTSFDMPSRKLEVKFSNFSIIQ